MKLLFTYFKPALYTLTLHNYQGKLFSHDNSKKVGKFLIKKSGKQVVRVIDTLSTQKEKLSPAAKQLIQKDIDKIIESPSKMDKSIPEIEPSSVLKNINSSFEAFFYQRNMDLKNFNFYLQVLAKQGKYEDTLQVISKMEAAGITPNETSYSHVLSAFGRNRQTNKIDEIMDTIKAKGLMITKSMWNGLIMSYAKSNDALNAEKIITEMKTQGYEPDIVCYTTVIDAYKRIKNYKKCWELYDQAKDASEVDEFLLSFMIRICAATHDAEKAMKLYGQLEGMGYISYCKPYNSIIFALGSRQDYAEKAIEIWRKMLMSRIVPDMHTYVGVLKATAHIGDVNTAYDVIQDLKMRGNAMNEYIYNGLIRTYAGACKVPYVQENHVDMYIKDAWELIKKMQESNIDLNVTILNSMVLMYANALKYEEMEGLVLPLYEKHGIAYNEFTYQHLIKLYLDIRNLDLVVSLYNNMRETGMTPNQEIVNCYLETSMRNKDLDKVIEALDTFKEIQKMPKIAYLKKLGETKDMPDRLYVELQSWPTFANANKGSNRFRKAHERNVSRKFYQIDSKRLSK